MSFCQNVAWRVIRESFNHYKIYDVTYLNWLFSIANWPLRTIEKANLMPHTVNHKSMFTLNDRVNDRSIIMKCIHVKLLSAKITKSLRISSPNTSRKPHNLPYGSIELNIYNHNFVSIGNGFLVKELEDNMRDSFEKIRLEGV